MSVQEQITRIADAKASLISAITAKGVSVPASAKLDALPGYVSQIDTGFKLVQLWTNPAPGSAFAAQTLALGLDGYDMYVVNAAHSTADDMQVSSMTPTGESERFTMQFAGSAIVGDAAVEDSYVGFWTATRQVTYSGGALIFTDATINGEVFNSLIIPVAIYGIVGGMAL